MFEIHKRCLKAERQVPLPIVYESVTLDVGYRLDLLVEDLVIVEIKAVSDLTPRFEAQLLSYLKLDNRQVGLLLNFHSVRLKDGIRRLVNRLPETT